MKVCLNPDPPQLITTEFGWYSPEEFDIGHSGHPD